MIHKLPSKSTIRAWLVGPEAPLAALCLLAIAGGVWLRIQALDYPRFMQLDEHHFVNAARAMLEGRPDTNDHPPLGKLLIALVLSVVQDGPIAWRMSSLLFGFGNILLARAFAKRLFGDARAGWLAAVFVAIDGFFIVYSRLALVDGVLVAFMLGAATLALCRHRALLVVSGLVVGLAAAVKFSGVVMLLPVTFAIAYRSGSARRGIVTTIGMLVAAVGAYCAVGAIAGWLGHVEQPWLYAWNDARSDLSNHMGTVGRAHPMTSRWTTWFVPETLVNFGFVLTRDGSVRMLSMVGNLLLWWSSPLCVLAGVALALRCVVGKGIRAAEPRSWGLLFVFWLVPLVPWMITDRDSYVYHYMPTYAFGLVAVAGAMSKLYERAPKWTLGLLGLVVVVSAFYAPLWGQRPLGYDGLALRLFLWR